MTGDSLSTPAFHGRIHGHCSFVTTARVIACAILDSFLGRLYAMVDGEVPARAFTGVHRTR